MTTSPISRGQFHSRLKESTVVGNPNWKGGFLTMFTMNNETSKPFYGEFDTSTFQLTKNANLWFTPSKIIGEYHEKEELTTTLSFKIEPIWFGYLWIRILPVFVLVLFNVLLFFQSETIIQDLIIPLNLFGLFMFTPIWLTSIQKRRMVKDFLEKFEVEGK